MFCFSHVIYSASVLYCVCMCVSAAILDQVSKSLSRRHRTPAATPSLALLLLLPSSCWPKFSHMHCFCCAIQAHMGLHLTSQKVGCPNQRLKVSRTRMMGWMTTLKCLIPTIPRLSLVRVKLFKRGINSGSITSLTTVHLSHQACGVTQGALARSLHRLFLRQLNRCHLRLVHQCLLRNLLMEMRHLLHSSFSHGSHQRRKLRLPRRSFQTRRSLRKRG